MGNWEWEGLDDPTGGAVCEHEINFLDQRERVPGVRARSGRHVGRRENLSRRLVCVS